MPTLIKRIELKNFLSFGPDSPAVELGPLNVLIGPNGSGKSNLVAGLDLFRRISRGMGDALTGFGDPRDLKWKGAPDNEIPRCAVDLANVGNEVSIRYRCGVWVRENPSRTDIVDERIERTELIGNATRPYFFFGYENGKPTINAKPADPSGGLERIPLSDFDPRETVLVQRNDNDRYPVIGGVAEALGKIRLYRDWQIGPRSTLRDSCKADVRSDFVREELDNLPIVLQNQRLSPPLLRALKRHLSELAPGFEDFFVNTEGARLQLYLQEPDWYVSTWRMSDGTLRFLSLLAVLLNPKPPAVTVIEEPELGLHPDLIPTLADLLREAAARTQVIVTTHSDILVDCFTATPNVVLVCEKRKGQTFIRPAAPSSVPLREGGKPPSLGKQWLQGTLGGKRW